MLGHFLTDTRTLLLRDRRRELTLQEAITDNAAHGVRERINVGLSDYHYLIRQFNRDMNMFRFNGLAAIISAALAEDSYNRTSRPS